MKSPDHVYVCMCACVHVCKNTIYPSIVLYLVHIGRRLQLSPQYVDMSNLVVCLLQILSLPPEPLLPSDLDMGCRDPDSSPHDGTVYWLVLCQLDTARVITEKGASVEEMPP